MAWQVRGSNGSDVDLLPVDEAGKEDATPSAPCNDLPADAVAVKL
jgi:hypothetical protein